MDLSAGTYTLAVGEIITVASNGPGGAWYCVSNSCAPVRQLQGSFAALKIATQGVSNFTSVITANAVVLTNSAGLAFVAGSVNVSPAINASGANGLDTGTLAASTWYYVWVIRNPTTATTAGLFSLSSTAPALPSGYTFAARVGAVRSQAASPYYLLQTLQYGRRVRYVLLAGSNLTTWPTLASGVAGTWSGATYSPGAVSLASSAPPTASLVGILGSQQQTSGAGFGFSSTNYTGYAGPNGGGPLQPYNNAGNNSEGNQVEAWLEYQGTNIYWASSNSVAYLYCLGWEDNL